MIDDVKSGAKIDRIFLTKFSADLRNSAPHLSPLSPVTALKSLGQSNAASDPGNIIDTIGEEQAIVRSLRRLDERMIAIRERRTSLAGAHDLLPLPPPPQPPRDPDPGWQRDERTGRFEPIPSAAQPQVLYATEDDDDRRDTRIGVGGWGLRSEIWFP